MTAVPLLRSSAIWSRTPRYWIWCAFVALATSQVKVSPGRTSQPALGLTIVRLRTYRLRAALRAL